MKKLIMSLIVAVSSLIAVPAFDGERSFKQSNGQTFTGSVKGDEWLHWIETKNGAVVIYNNNSKDYEYATIREIDGQEVLVASGRKLGQINTNKSLASAKNNLISKADLERLANNVIRPNFH
jgi:hypothetical protein